MNVAGKNARIMLTPDPSWQWIGWDGQAELRLAHGPLEAGEPNQNVLTFNDIPNHRDITFKREYLTVIPTGAFDVKGMMGPVDLVVDPPPTPSILDVDGSPVVLESTTGTFTVSPTTRATNSQSGAMDAAVPKSGTWRIIDPCQQILSAE